MKMAELHHWGQRGGTEGLGVLLLLWEFFWVLVLFFFGVLVSSAGVPQISPPPEEPRSQKNTRKETATMSVTSATQTGAINGII